ncbi:MoaD/ThiS family protein [Polaribacter sargassicola]|uniref:MoaD/ThiS family protein n=1 Tax=Polaribacter sargassicola TaxID=2836891 RepID=UPI001F21756F|nr:MoaD/ThiS family protein [Polaribacter sp. DS7-9]MCG1034936.1 MoaD/ThiS family protein [Polaribacter sp. DS7-9]
MKIQTLFFGITTDLVGVASLDLEISEATTIIDFKNYLKQKYPALDKIDSYAVAVNESYAADNLLLKENDVVAIIPPVSGG